MKVSKNSTDAQKIIRNSQNQAKRKHKISEWITEIEQVIWDVRLNWGNRENIVYQDGSINLLKGIRCSGENEKIGVPIYIWPVRNPGGQSMTILSVLIIFLFFVILLLLLSAPEWGVVKWRCLSLKNIQICI